MKIVKRTNENLNEIVDFYNQNGYGGGAKEDDHIFLLKENESIICVVRISIENSISVLRGMYVKEEARGKGIGKEVLNQLVPFLDEISGDIFCVPKTHLKDFYGLIGFKEIAVNEAPIHLQERASKYRDDGHPVIIMKRNRNV